MSQLFKIFKSEKRKIPPELPKRDYFKYSSISTKDSKISKIGYDVILVSDYCDPIDCKVKHLESIDQLSPIKASSKSLIGLDSVVPNLDEVKEYEEDALLYSYSLPLTECDQLSIDTDSLMIETSLRESPSPQSVNCSQHLSRIFKENFQPIKSILSDRIKLDNRYCSKYDKGMAVLNRWSRNRSNIGNKLAHSNCLFKDNLYCSHRRQGSESSFSFTTDQSSISSTTSSSPSSSHDSSSILKHLDPLPANVMLPKRQGIKTNLNIPRSRSSDITLNLLASEAERSGESARRPKTKLGSTYYLLKSTNFDAISSFDSDSDSSTKCLLKSSQESATSAATKVSISNKTLNNSSSKETLTTTKSTITVNSSDVINSSTSKSEKLESNQSVKLINSDKISNLKGDTVTSSACDSKPRLQSPSNDTRPLDDYDSPWDTEQRLNKVVEDIISSPTPTGLTATSTTPTSPTSPPPPLPPPPPPLPSTSTSPKLATSAKLGVSSTQSSAISTNLKSSFTTNKAESNEDNLKSISSQVSIQSQSTSANFSEVKPSLKSQSNPSSSLSSTQPTSKPNKLSLNLNTNFDDNLSTSSTPNLNLDIGLGTENSKKMIPRKKPTLSFSQQLLPVVCEDVDSSLPLEKQGWYHGSITRFDAENLLRPMKEGSYLIRNCESTKQDFSLSLKSTKGFMHMKIVKNSDKYVLGVFSKPFSTIPEMVKHYTINKLPIRGAEHMSLLYPVIDQLL